MGTGQAVYRKCPMPEAVEKAAHIILNNRVVEAILVGALGAAYLGTKAFDGLFGTRLRRSYVEWMQGASRDRLNFLRKARIRHVFKKNFGLRKIKIKVAGGSYWLSIPCIVKGIDKNTREEKKYMAKVMGELSALKHNYMTLMRNMGVLAGGVGPRFEGYHCGLEMGEYERHCLERLRESGINAPAAYGLYKLGGDDYMLVMEYIEGKPLSGARIDAAVLDQLFSIFEAMREHSIFHGDVKLDNFMLSGGAVYVFDCLKIDRSNAGTAAAFDLACLLCALAEKVPVDVLMARARLYFSDRELEGAEGMLDMALYKTDLELSEDKVRELRSSFHTGS